MNSLLNPDRPPVFCPGCAHERIVQVLNQTFQSIGLSGDQIAIVTDIGCSGLFDTFYNTHAFHGLHGRALTYATGLKMARPDLHVVVTMGDGGLGIGGAHVLSTCRRNIDITLLVLNNFNYGMTGGQCSSTTPADAQVGSGFLNRLEKPIDICQVAGAAGAPFVTRASTYAKDLAKTLEAAIGFEGFSVVDIWGICPGRYTRRNKLTPKAISAQLEQLAPVDAFSTQNARKEYGRAYREEASKLQPAPPPLQIEAKYEPPDASRQELLILGNAGQRIITAGELVCLAGATAGLHATQKNDYPITVMRGHSVSELILSKEEIGYTGIDKPSNIIALGQEGVNRRKKIFAELTPDTLVLKAAGVDLPATVAEIREIDFKAHKVKSQDWALAAIIQLARTNRMLSVDMLNAALGLRFKGKVLAQVREVVDRFAIS
jgi:pyruvate/2-oxoacid:ferredoxin oxidoreductase beta subunit/Pyruvate/2-oxoacid:ferredoxin oxidoreductase gamma subunit